VKNGKNLLILMSASQGFAGKFRDKMSGDKFANLFQDAKSAPSDFHWVLLFF
jgi:hypothetical protein